MKKKDKYIMSTIGIFGVLFGRILNRVLSEYFGYNNSAVIIMSVVLVSLLGIIIGLIAKGYYIGAIIFLVMFMPLLGIGIGAYLDNRILVVLSLLLFIIILLILLKIVPKLKRDK